MLNGKILGSLIMSQMVSKGMYGPMVPAFSMALGDGIVSSFISTNSVLTTDIGMMTWGYGKGKMIGINGQALFALVAPLMMASGIAGPQGNPMAQAICDALSMHLLTMNEVETFHMGVGIGTGIGKVSGLDPNAMAYAVSSQMSASNLNGVQLVPLIRAIASGLCSHLMTTAIINVTIIPIVTTSPVPIPSVGIGKGTIK